MILKRFMKPFIWLGVICYGLFIPAHSIPKTSLLKIPHFDKLVHFGMFFVFCLLLFVPFKKLKLNPYLFASLTALFFATLLEWLQQYVTITRSSDFFDFLANVSGIAVSTLFFHFVISGKKREKYF
jgi:VanZ family protein